MNTRWLLFLIAFSLLVINAFFQFFFRQSVLYLLNISLPFRESYFPSISGFIYVYLFPLVLGYLFCSIFSGKTNKFIYYLNLSLFFGIVNFLPFLLNGLNGESNWFINLALMYYLVLFPFLFLIGGVPYYFHETNAIPYSNGREKRVSFPDYCIAFLFGLLLFLLNLIPKTLSGFLVGADVYYHAALSQKISESSSLFQNPFFLEEKNYYYSLGYYLFAYIHKIAHIDFTTLWMVCLPIFSSIFLSSFYLLSKRLSRSSSVGIIATIFVVPFNQILWFDPSLRVISYGFFLLFLLSFQSLIMKPKIISVFLSVFFFFSTISMHPEIAIHTVIITIIFYFIQYNNLAQAAIANGIVRISHMRMSLPSSFHLNALDNFDNFLILIVLYSCILTGKYLYFFNSFQIDKVFIFNEIPLSIVQPIGVISFIVFMFFPLGLYQSLSKLSVNNILLLSLFSLSGSVFFYFSHLWSLYHRYFAETAYFSVAFYSASAIVSVLKWENKKNKIGLILIILGLLFLSIIPKYNFISTYSLSTETIVKEKIQSIDLINRNTSLNSVIFINPDNLINRYIPFYADRYIFAGNSEISKEHQWQVLSFCNGPFAKACSNRQHLADSFFLNPSRALLLNIKKQYEVDYLAVDKTSPEEVAKFAKSDLHLHDYLVKEDDSFTLYDVRGIQ